jgi:hypothetical protein
MKWLRLAFAGILATSVGGCFTDQERQVAQCQLESDAFYKGDQSPTSPIMTDLRTITCMQAHGYEQSIGRDRRCPNLRQPSEDADFAWCYRPMGWGARQVYNIEMALGR